MSLSPDGTWVSGESQNGAKERSVFLPSGCPHGALLIWSIAVSRFTTSPPLQISSLMHFVCRPQSCSLNFSIPDDQWLWRLGACGFGVFTDVSAFSLQLAVNVSTCRRQDFLFLVCPPSACGC